MHVNSWPVYEECVASLYMTRVLLQHAYLYCPLLPRTALSLLHLMHLLFACMLPGHRLGCV